jgi:hypothetical protein
VRTFGAINRFLSAINTSYSPEFVISNALRDLQTASINLSGEKVKGMVRGVLKDYPAALKARPRARSARQRRVGQVVSRVQARRAGDLLQPPDDLAVLRPRWSEAAKAGAGSARSSSSRRAT